MKRRYTVILICVCIAVIGLWYVSFFERGQTKLDGTEMETAESAADDTDFEEESNTSKACISGEVNNPGIYSIKQGDRIADVIEMAGGTTENADLYGINLAKYVNDEDNIIIPGKTDNTGVDKSEVSVQNNSSASLININTADADELMSLNGIGEKLAEDIIAYRNENNGFKTIDEIKNVNRIGDAVFNKIKDKITV